MVTVRIIGGLGNQMFQYAAARRLALKRGVPLMLDISGFRKYRLHQGYRLDHLSLPRDVQVHSGSPWARDLLSKLMATIPGGQSLPRDRSRTVHEKHYHFDPSILSLSGDVYLDGYWQSPKYFSDVESAIRREFSVSTPMSGMNLELATRIAESPSASVHVRRGDYVNNPDTGRYHGLCNAEYYAAAEAKLRELVGDVRLFVFSDDPDWAEENLRFRSPAVVVRQNGAERDFEDLRLMSQCLHHIIANSTFSWWGAWLCMNPRKVILAPRNWFREAMHITTDLIPDNWIRI